MPHKQSQLSKFAWSLLDDEAKETSGSLERELEDACDGSFEKEMVWFTIHFQTIAAKKIHSKNK